MSETIKPTLSGSQARGIETVLSAVLADPGLAEDYGLDGRNVRAARSGLVRLTEAIDAAAAGQTARDRQTITQAIARQATPPKMAVRTVVPRSA